MKKIILMIGCLLFANLSFAESVDGFTQPSKGKGVIINNDSSGPMEVQYRFCYVDSMHIAIECSPLYRVTLTTAPEGNNFINVRIPEPYLSIKIFKVIRFGNKQIETNFSTRNGCGGANIVLNSYGADRIFCSDAGTQE